MFDHLDLTRRRVAARGRCHSLEQGCLGWEPFNVVLYYPDNGFAVEYIMTKQSFGEYFVGCPKQVREINITTWNVKESKTLEDIAQNNPAFWGMSPGNLAVYYKTIEEALSQTPENFYEIYKNLSEFQLHQSAYGIVAISLRFTLRSARVYPFGAHVLTTPSFDSRLTPPPAIPKYDGRHTLGF